MVENGTTQIIDTQDERLNKIHDDATRVQEPAKEEPKVRRTLWQKAVTVGTTGAVALGALGTGYMGFHEATYAVDSFVHANIVDAAGEGAVALALSSAAVYIIGLWATGLASDTDDRKPFRRDAGSKKSSRGLPPYFKL